MARKPEPPPARDIIRNQARRIANWPDPDIPPGGAVLDALDPDRAPIRNKPAQ